VVHRPNRVRERPELHLDLPPDLLPVRSDRAELARLGVKVYDLSQISDGWINHGAYASAPDVVRQIGAQLTRARKEDSQTTSVIDAGVEESRPQTNVVESKPLDAPAAAQ